MTRPGPACGPIPAFNSAVHPQLMEGNSMRMIMLAAAAGATLVLAGPVNA
jgi:hypothetical protein